MDSCRHTRSSPTEVLKSLLVIAISVIGAGFGLEVQAQVNPDNSLGEESSVVTPNVEVKGETADRIDGGAIRERNLFHSFSEFNVGEAQRVYFANPSNIEQIFTRVTGSDPSKIMGTLGVDGAADLLLLNPNGIIFGENSSLDVEGSFFGTSADSLLFEDETEFSATEPNSSLLTVSVPLGLQVGDNPGKIEVRSPLSVPNGQNFSLVGGEISLLGGNITTDNGINTPEDGIIAPGGRVELGGLSASGIVGIEENGSLSFPEEITRADIKLNNFAIDVSAGDDGSISVKAKNLELFNSALVTGIDSSVELASAQAGDITINATERVLLESSEDSGSEISSFTGDFSAFRDSENIDIINTQGNAGNITINTSLLEGRGSFNIGSFTNGEGNAGFVNITATNSISLSARELTPENPSGVFSSVAPLGTGNGANIFIDAPSFALSNSTISTSIGGSGNAGNLTVNTARLNVENSGISADSVGSGNAGNVNIAASEFVSLIDSVLNTETRGEGNAGNLTVDTARLNVENSGISAGSLGSGNAGNLGIAASEFVSLRGTTPLDEENTLVIGLSTSAVGDGDAVAGNIAIDTGNLMITKGAQIQAATGGTEDGGDIAIEADRIELSNSGIFTETGGSGNAGNLTVDTARLTVEDSGISAVSVGSGNAGNLSITASEFISLSDSVLNTGTSGEGNAGNLTVDTARLTVEDSGIFAATSGSGNAGNLSITASEFISLRGITPLDEENSIFTGLSTSAIGNGDAVGGNIAIDTGNLMITKGAQIQADTLGTGDGGDITIEADRIELTGNSALFTEADGSGNAGDLTVNTARLTVEDSGISTVSVGSGNAGNLSITASEFISLRGIAPLDEENPIFTGLSTSTTGGAAGNIAIETENLMITEEAEIQAVTVGTEDGGDITITTNNLAIEDRAEITASSVGNGNAGTILAQVRDFLELNNGSIISFSDRSAGGEISIDAGNIRLRGDSDIRTNVGSGVGGGGNITFSADSIVALDDSDIIANSADGTGGNITLDTDAFFASPFNSAFLNAEPLLDNNNRVDLSATGSINNGVINIPDINFLPNSLIELSEDTIDADEVVANSCVVRNGQPGGTFVVTGAEGLRSRPGDSAVADYPTGKVRAILDKQATVRENWQQGDSVDEPEGVYRLSNGKLVLSRECS